MSRCKKLVERFKKVNEAAVTYRSYKSSSRKDSLGKPFTMRDYNQQMDFFAYPSEEYFHQNGVSAYLVLTAYDKNIATEVNFVSGNNGDEFGQFAEKADALKKAKEMAKLTKEDRRQYDESLNEDGHLRPDLKYRVHLNKKDGKYDLQFYAKTTGTWIHVKDFSNKEAAHKYLIDNKAKA